MTSRRIPKRIGLLVPSSDITLEYEFCKNLPEGIELHVTRMPLGKVTPKKLALMAEESSKAVALIMDAEPHLIVYGCTSGSFIGGKGYDEKIEHRITKQTGVRSITVAHAVVDALNALEINSLSVCTPYIDEINQIEKEFFTKCGFEIKSIHGMGIIEDIAIGKLEPQRIYSFIVRHDDPTSDAMFISCTNVKTLSLITMLRRKLSKPIVSSNLATLWDVCKYLGVRMYAPIFDDLRHV